MGTCTEQDALLDAVRHERTDDDAWTFWLRWADTVKSIHILNADETGEEASCES